MADRDTYKYILKDGNEIVDYGITNDLERREQEHRSEGLKFTKMEKVGIATTREAAGAWQKRQHSVVIPTPYITIKENISMNLIIHLIYSSRNIGIHCPVELHDPAVYRHALVKFILIFRFNMLGNWNKKSFCFFIIVFAQV